MRMGPSRIWFVVVVLSMAVWVTDSYYATFARRRRPTFGPMIPTTLSCRPLIKQHTVSFVPTTTVLLAAKLEPVPDELEGLPVPFVDTVSNQFIECFADSVTTHQGVTYTIGAPCDTCVALCYFDDEQQLVPIELNDVLMEDVFPLARSIVEDEFGEELSLERTPQTLTLVGELDEDDDDDDDDDDLDHIGDDEDDDEKVEVLLTFEYKNREYLLVKLLDPILLVGKPDPNNANHRLLLLPDESDAVMPALEELFLDETAL